MNTVCRYYPLNATFANTSPEKIFAFDHSEPGDGEIVRDEFLREANWLGYCGVEEGTIPSGCDIDNHKVTVYRYREHMEEPWSYFGLAVVEAE